jgi:N-acetyl-1-D-myo-inositol-2-amino-2-deoxy-alpha-D-glucopyranoside deacetylase
VERAADPAYAPETGAAWTAGKLYWTALPKSVLQTGIDQLKASGQTNFFGADSADDLPFGVPDDRVTTEIDAREHLGAKVAAMRAHASQIAVDGPFFALSDNLGQQAMGVEYYQLAQGARTFAEGREPDLFGGAE